jgi:threonine/homoserine/homoserine lactone efflux protein
MRFVGGGMDYSILGLYILTVSALISTPGPVVMVVMNTSLAQGSLQGIKTILGTNIASLLWIIVAALVINQALTVHPFLLSTLKILGCCYIIYLAYKSLPSLSRSARDENNTSQQALATKSAFQTGLMVGLSNPKDMIFFAAFFPQFMGLAPTKNASLAWLTGVWILLDLAILSCYVWLMSQKQVYRWRRLIILFSSLCLLGVALVSLVHSLWELKITLAK